MFYKEAEVVIFVLQKPYLIYFGGRCNINIPRHTIVAGYYGFTLVVRVSVRPSYVLPSVRFSFPDDNLNINGFSLNLVCALIL